MSQTSAYTWRDQACPVCERPPSTLLGTRGGRAHREGLGEICDVWRCDGCGLVLPNPMPVPTGGTGQHYALDADAYFTFHDTDHKVELGRAVMRTAEGLLGRTGRVLDVGSGRGELLRAARELGWDAVGLEPSPTFADHIASAHGIEVVRAPIERAELEPESFDAVILAAVLEHLYNPDDVIREIARALRPGGVVFLDVPNEAGVYFRLGNLYQRLRGRDWVVNLSPTFAPYHVFGFTPRSLRALLAKHGLEPVVWRTYGGASNLPSRAGLLGRAEQALASAAVRLSNVVGQGTYIETWATKR